MARPNHQQTMGLAAIHFFDVQQHGIPASKISLIEERGKLLPVWLKVADHARAIPALLAATNVATYLI
jgi:hypothetical protein